MHDSSKKAKRTKRRRSPWKHMSYTTRVALSFALVSAMTALVAFGVLSFVWEQHFQTYTRENIQRLAETTATSIGQKYATSHSWYSGALTPAESAGELSGGVGVQVVDAHGNVVYDDSRTTDSNSQISLAPTDRDSMAQATIYSDGENVGTVRVWVYGSNTLLTQADQEFRSQSYKAMIFASCLAVVLAFLLGFWFARTLVDPISRISRAARKIGQGDLSARTQLSGYDEISQLGETFDAMAASVEKDRNLERRLTTDVAHELRTPLMAIQSTVEAMVDGVYDVTPERLETVDSEVQRLSRLVDAILKLSRLENGSTRLKPQLVNVGDLISSIIATHEAFVRDAGLTLVYDAEPDVYVWGDPDMISQAVANLISNAVRYTAEGSVTVTVKAGSEMAQISVADTGIGLSPEEAKNVFGRFWRADSARTREKGGLGIGLSMVKEIVDQHDGWVRVEGEKGKGATFTIYIPLFNEERVKEQKAREKRALKGQDANSGDGAAPSRGKESEKDRASLWRKRSRGKKREVDVPDDRQEGE